MKNVYWRPRKISATTTFAMGVLAIALLCLVEYSSYRIEASHAEQMKRANDLARKCREQIKAERQRRGCPVHALFDPTRSGLLGVAMSPLTSKPADLEAKQISLHPQLPSVAVDLLQQAGIQRGDTVAVGWTGSFPAMNVALAAAIEAMELKPIAVASVTASQYGANEEAYTWLDMEAGLFASKLIHFRSQMATPGGPADRCAGMGEEVLALVQSVAARNRVPLVCAKRLQDSISKRVQFVDERSGKSRVAAYINVGGGTASCGGRDCVFPAGLTSSPPSRQAIEIPDCVMQRFADRQVPVIHLGNVKSLARRYSLSVDPQSWDSDTQLNVAAGPHRGLATVALVMLGGLLWAFIRHDIGSRWTHRLQCFLTKRPSLRAVGRSDGPELMA